MLTGLRKRQSGFFAMGSEVPADGLPRACGARNDRRGWACRGFWVLENGLPCLLRGLTVTKDDSFGSAYRRQGQAPRLTGHNDNVHVAAGD